MADASEIETVAENHLRKQMIRGTRHPHTHSKIDFPFGLEIEVNGGEDLLFVLIYPGAARYPTPPGGVLDSPPQSLGENVKAGFEPIIEAVGDLDGFMQLVIRGKRPVIGGFGALKREI